MRKNLTLKLLLGSDISIVSTLLLAAIGGPIKYKTN